MLALTQELTTGAPLVALLVALAGIAGTFFGAKRWRENYEAADAGRREADLRREEAEKEAATQKAFADERAVHAAALQSMVDELGGRRVYEVLVQEQAHASERHEQQMSLFADQFSRIGKALAHHEERAEVRTDKLIDAIDKLANGGNNS